MLFHLCVNKIHSELEIDEKIKIIIINKNQEVQVYIRSLRVIELSSYQFELNVCSVTLLKARKFLRYAEDTGDRNELKPLTLIQNTA